MNEGDGARRSPFVRFDVTIERLPDGRTIRSYTWPPDADREADERPASADAPSGPQPEGADE